jgi:hypothetical protein
MNGLDSPPITPHYYAGTSPQVFSEETIDDAVQRHDSHVNT